MKKYRIKFVKLGKIKFIGHLDLLKMFQRAVKRSGLPITYSQGFNPHQQTSFAIPLSLGMESEGEYVDVQLNEEIEPSAIVERLNAVMPIGMTIINARELEEKEKNCAAILDAAIYEIELDRRIEGIEGIIENMLSQGELLIDRTSKRVTKEVDIKADIYSVEVSKTEGKTKLKILISAGSNRNLKPDLFLEYLYKYMALPFERYKFGIKRIDLLKSEDGSFVGL